MQVSSKKILHLIQQEKITSQIIENFFSLKLESCFLVYDNGHISFLSQDEREDIEVLDINYFIKDKNIKGIIVHGLFPQFAKVINSIEDNNITIAWFAWGFDVYNQPKVKHLLYEHETAIFVRRGKTFKDLFKSVPFLRSLIFFLLKKDDNEKVLQQARNRINYFCTYIEEDYNFYKEHFKTESKFYYTPFCTIAQYLSGNESLRVSVNAANILIGNSNSAENNHIDVFGLLAKINVESGEFIVPLSYGTNEKYKEFVIESGQNLLGSKFIPLLDFMNRASYLEMLENCSAAVFYHNRQQAMGNIIALLYMGVRVYLSSKNPIYHYFKRVGLHVYDFNKEYSIFRNSLLEENYMKHNKEVLKNLFSKEEVQNRLTKLIIEL